VDLCAACNDKEPKYQGWIEANLIFVAPDEMGRVVTLNVREGDPVGIETNVGFTSVDVDADHAALRDRGVDADEAVMRMGDPVPPMFFFRDQDGNKFLIVERS